MGLQKASKQDPTESVSRTVKGLNDLRVQMKNYLSQKEKSSNPVILLSSLDKLGKQLELVQLNSALAECVDWLKRERESLSRKQDEFKTQLASELPKLLSQDIFKIGGSFPKLNTSFFTIVLDFINNSAAIWYGPEDTLLKKVALDALSIANAVKEEHRRLLERSMSPTKFLELLYQAYLLVAFQDKREKVPLGKVLPVIALLNQETEFLNDPTRERYRAYGRAQFSYDIYKAGSKEFQGKQVELETATMSESKKKSDYLWVPSNEQGAGHIKSTIWFREAS